MAHLEAATMLSRITSLLLVLPITLAIGNLAQGGQEPGTQGYIEKSREGWFFYREPPPEDEDETERAASWDKLPPEVWMDPEKHRAVLKRLPLEGVDLKRLPSVFLRELVTAKREVALDDPTVPAVTDYIVAQQAAYNRAQRFTDSYQVAMITRPDLDYGSKHPSSVSGHQVEAQVQRESEDNLLAQQSSKIGLFFFFTSTCPYCQEQAKTLKLLSDTYNISVFPVSMDGRGLPEYPRPARDNGMAEKVGVHMVPMVYLAIPQEQFLKPVGAGIMTLAELRERVLVLLQRRELLLPSNQGKS